ncbi:Protein 5NUC [Monoraphidium neglectum]|uniref:Protein 5NUC n=1 Tax=Monoraphidium neglectum TaxID=145388 RepID=A0A0D2JIN8_9CHLO|nr:Protein 5NUC [Monoraphidium neglectum]KIY99167.1 Protein 5NUC [Monoraphidium neglectum]|eukprot:XP_013898187.1 Protein 5NUC [Monoraphidium neglectum]
MARAALLLVLVLGMCSCVRGRRGRSLAAAPAPKELHIVHINDVHNRIEQTSTSSTTCSDAQAASGLCLGGWGRISSYVNAARKKAAAAKAAFLFLDAGDQFDGTLWDVVYKGAATAKMQNIVKPDVMVRFGAFNTGSLKNLHTHGLDSAGLAGSEFTFPPDILKAYIGNITFPMLGACNTDTSDEPLLKGLIQKWKVWQFGPYKVAAVGWLTPDASFTAANIGKVKVTPVNAAVKQCIADLKKAHPDVHLIIGMSHTGYHPDIETAKQVPDLDIIISGHSHTFLRTPSKVGPIFDKTVNATDETCLKKRACDEPGGPYPTYVSSQKCSGVGAAKTCTNKTIPVVQVYYASKYIGDVTLDLATKKVTAAKPVLLGGDNSTSPWPQDPVILAEIEKLSGPVTALEKKPAGKTSVVMIGGRPGRVAETNFGSYLADIMKNGPVTIALINSGSIRANIEPELVNYGDVLTALPFRNLLAVKLSR